MRRVLLYAKVIFQKITGNGNNGFLWNESSLLYVLYTVTLVPKV